MLFCLRVICMTLYERIRQLRIQAGMSQDDLAKAMGYRDRSMITKIESGKVDISQKKVLAFAHVLNTTPGYLMGIDDSTSDVEPAVSPIHHPEIRLLAKKLDMLPKEQREQALDVFNAMYHKFFDNLEDENK